MKKSGRLRKVLRWIALGLAASLLAGGATSVWWLSRYAIAVHRLTRGVGDTVFYGADGQPWFRLDEQRHDVSLSDISPDLQHAVIAVEDRRFFLHPGIDPIGIARARARRGQRRTGRGAAPSRSSSRGRCFSRTCARTPARRREARIALLIEAQLSKQQILSCISIACDLSAGDARRRYRCRNTCSESRPRL
jgi:penicillin-binding protein 1A